GSPAPSASSTTSSRSRSVARRSVTRMSLRSEEGIAHPHEQPEQYHAEHQAPRDELHLGRQQGLFHHEVTRGGTMPWKKIHDTASPTQTMKPKRQTTYTSARRPMPSCPSFRKSEATPIVKNVIAKKSTRKTLVSAVAPLATAAPSVLTASPIHAPATSGWWARKVCAAKGRISSSTTANTTTSDEIMIGTMGRARIAAAVAMAAETPQMLTPEASGAAHSRVRPKKRRATRYTTAQ